MKHSMDHKKLSRFAVVLAGVTVMACGLLAATGYVQTNLTSNNASGHGAFTDPNLVNAWGVAYLGTGVFWVTDNGTGKSTLYADNGQPQSLVVTVPPASGTGTGSPTGIVANATTDFKVTEGAKSGAAAFIFDSEDGVITGWSPTVNATGAVIAVNNSSTDAVYKGLAIGVNAGANVLYATNFFSGKVEMYDGSFNLVSTFTDTHGTAGYAPFGIQNINGTLYVTFAKQNASKQNQVNGAGLGFVDAFDQSGTLIMRVASHGKLNAPWGLAVAPANFGTLSNDLLVANVGDGKINAYSPTTGAFLGTVENSAGKPIAISGLWGIEFGNGGQGGPTNSLFFAAGPKGYASGLFGTLTAAAAR